jgi:uncharacterized cupredoxin-like copper-binding protein
MRGTALPAAVAASLLVLAGCQSAERAAAKHDADAPAAAAATVAAAPSVVTVHAHDFAFQMPDTIASGMTTFHLVNDGPGLHHAVIVRLDSAKTPADLEQALKTPGAWPRWAPMIGGPNAVDPHSDANATLAMTPGNYAIICLVDLPGGVPHFAKGMVHPLTVTPSAGASAAAPTADEVVTLTDYHFALSTPLTAGSHTFEVQNHAAQPHEVAIIQLAPGKTAKDALQWLQKPSGPPPGRVMGGSAPAIPGEPVYFTMNVTPGQYLLMCFVPDAKDGKPHFMHGMMQTVTVS